MNSLNSSIGTFSITVEMEMAATVLSTTVSLIGLIGVLVLEGVIG
jgi:uncharacterized membrane protein